MTPLEEHRQIISNNIITILKNFIDSNKVSCIESIFQVDKTNIALQDLASEVFTELDYWYYGDEEDNSN